MKLLLSLLISTFVFAAFEGPAPMTYFILEVSAAKKDKATDALVANIKNAVQIRIANKTFADPKMIDDAESKNRNTSYFLPIGPEKNLVNNSSYFPLEKMTVFIGEKTNNSLKVFLERYHYVKKKWNKKQSKEVTVSFKKGADPSNDILDHLIEFSLK